MVIRINVPVLLKLDPAYEEKLVSKAIDLYINDPGLKRGRYSQTTTKHSNSNVASHSDSPDLFLPVASSVVVSQHENLHQLLGDYEFLGTLSDEELQSGGESADETESEGEGEVEEESVEPEVCEIEDV